MKSIKFFQWRLACNQHNTKPTTKTSCRPNQLISGKFCSSPVVPTLTYRQHSVWKGYQHHGFDAFFFFLPIWNVALWSSQWVPQLNLKQLQGWFGAVSRWFSGFFQWISNNKQLFSSSTSWMISLLLAGNAWLKVGNRQRITKSGLVKRGIADIPCFLEHDSAY